MACTSPSSARRRKLFLPFMLLWPASPHGSSCKLFWITEPVYRSVGALNKSLLKSWIIEGDTWGHFPACLTFLLVEGKKENTRIRTKHPLAVLGEIHLGDPSDPGKGTCFLDVLLAILADKGLRLLNNRLDSCLAARIGHPGGRGII